MGTPVAVRRKAYRLRNMRAGKCWKCPAPIFADRSVCLKHYVYYHLTKRGLTKGVLSVRNARLRDMFVAFIRGRYEAVISGYLVPGDDQQRLKDVTEFRLRAGIKWGGFRGGEKMAALVRNLDYRALRERKKACTEAS